VGIGSFLFHATLRYWAQWLDELPMLYGNLVCCYIIIEHEKLNKHRFLPIFLAAFGVGLTILYVGFPQYYGVFMSVYTMTCVIITVLAIHRINQLPKKKPTTKLLIRIYVLSTLSYATGFIIWVTENTFCASIPQWLHLHAWWHILAGLGCYLWLQAMVVFRAIRLGSKPRTESFPLLHVVVEPAK